MPGFLADTAEEQRASPLTRSQFLAPLLLGRGSPLGFFSDCRRMTGAFPADHSEVRKSEIPPLCRNPKKKGQLQNRWKLAYVLAAAANLVTAGVAQQVLTESGTISGVSANGLSVFKGVPFAAPPVGDLRWRPPMPAAPWIGTRKADAFAPACAKSG
jgi:hypothetical protein